MNNRKFVLTLSRGGMEIVRDKLLILLDGNRQTDRESAFYAVGPTTVIGIAVVRVGNNTAAGWRTG
ncbi:MAG: hypothetical protein ACR2IV_12495 [Bryobacteraceae bacterium]